MNQLDEALEILKRAADRIRDNIPEMEAELERKRADVVAHLADLEAAGRRLASIEAAISHLEAN